MLPIMDVIQDVLANLADANINRASVTTKLSGRDVTIDFWVDDGSGPDMSEPDWHKAWHANGDAP